MKSNRRHSEEFRCGINVLALKHLRYLHFFAESKVTMIGAYSDVLVDFTEQLFQINGLYHWLNKLLAAASVRIEKVASNGKNIHNESVTRYWKLARPLALICWILIFDIHRQRTKLPRCRVHLLLGEPSYCLYRSVRSLSSSPRTPSVDRLVTL